MAGRRRRDEPGPRSGGEPATESALPARDEAFRTVRAERREVGADSPAGLGADAGVGGSTLVGLLAFHPLMSFFCWVADRQYPDSHRADTRVARLRDRDAAFYWVCVTVDVVLVTTAAALLLVAAAAALYKTLVR